MTAIRRTLGACVWIGMAAVTTADDSLNVIVAPGAQLGAYRSFAFRASEVKSPRPELDNPLFVKTLTRTLRSALVGRGLVEVTGAADLLVDFTVTGEDVATSQRGGGRGIGPQPLRYTIATLVVDLSEPGQAAPVWRGVYRDEEPNGSNLVSRLPGDAAKLIEKYPKRR